MQESNRRRPARVGQKDNNYYYEDDCCCSSMDILEDICADHKGLIVAGMVSLAVFIVGYIAGRLRK